MAKFQKKPVIIEAIQFDGSDESAKACGLEVTITETGVQTLEGFMRASPGDWIITGVKGERYPCKPDIFEKTYKPVDLSHMNFGDAIQVMKAGKRVARAGWNGKGMWVAFTPGSVIDPFHARAGAASHLAQQHYAVVDSPLKAKSIEICGHIDMKAADGSLVIGWLASQTDMLAEDWVVLG